MTPLCGSQGAIGETYTIKAGEVGKAGDAISVVVGFTDRRGGMEMATSETSVTYTNTVAVVTGLPTITGMPKVGETLTADTSAIEDADGLPATFTYEWQSAGTAISGATEKTYTVKVGEPIAGGVGVVTSEITVVVTFTDDGGTGEMVTSDDSVTYANTPATGVPTITGTVQVGEALTADIDNIADVDGLADPPTGLEYQWKVAGINVGTGGDTYTVTNADVGKLISVVVTFTDDGGTGEMVTSARTSEVPATPVNVPATGLPTITPNTNVMVGSVLTANTSAIEDENGPPETFNYQWLANDTDTGGTGTTYTVRLARCGQGHHCQGDLHR